MSATFTACVSGIWRQQEVAGQRGQCVMSNHLLGSGSQTHTSSSQITGERPAASATTDIQQNLVPKPAFKQDARETRRWRSVWVINNYSSEFKSPDMTGKKGISEKTKKRKNPAAAAKTEESCGVTERKEARYRGKEQRNGGITEM